MKVSWPPWKKGSKPDQAPLYPEEEVHPTDYGDFYHPTGVAAAGNNKKKNKKNKRGSGGSGNNAAGHNMEQANLFPEIEAARQPRGE